MAYVLKNNTLRQMFGRNKRKKNKCIEFFWKKRLNKMAQSALEAFDRSWLDFRALIKNVTSMNLRHLWQLFSTWVGRADIGYVIVHS